MFDKYRKGQIAIMKVQLRAAELGVVVAVPTTEARYDLILEDRGRLYRAQVKYAGSPPPRTKGSVILDLRKATRGNGRVRPYSKKEVDVVLVYVPQVDQVVWLGPEVFDMLETVNLRFDPSKNNQKKRTFLIEDHIWKTACDATGSVPDS